MIENINKNDKIEQIDNSKLVDFANNPFKIREDEQMESLMKSIKEIGIITPLIVRKKDDETYEIISGRRRRYAARKFGIRSLNCIVKNLSDDEATILMVDSNIQREDILPSEKAYAYKLKLDALKHQGKKLDLVKEIEDFNENSTSDQVGPKLKSVRSNEILAEHNKDSITTIKRYIRLTYLIPEILELVDKQRIKLTPAVELSFLNKENQYCVFEKYERDEVTPSLSQAIKLKKLQQEGELTTKKLEKILDELKPNQLENKDIKFYTIKRFFPKDFTDEKIKETIYSLLKNYYQKWHNKDRDVR